MSELESLLPSHADEQDDLLQKKLSVLVIAYACNPYRGSEHGVGWGWLGMIAENHEVCCIVSKDDENDIEKFCRDNPTSPYTQVEFVFVEHQWNRTINRVFPPYYLWQFRRQWQRDAFHAAKKLHERRRFALCHLVTYVGYRVPGEFYKLDCPFVWGPIGGLENTAWSLLPIMGLRGTVHYGLRNIINSCHKRYLHEPKQAFKKAAAEGAVISATGEVKREIEKWYGVDSTVICEVGPPRHNHPPTLALRTGEEPFRIAWSGQLLPGKALPVLLEALSRLGESHSTWCLSVLGDGPCRDSWKRRADRLGLSNRITWHGHVPRSDVLETLKRAHAFVITSLKDLTSSVLLESLAAGLPVVCPDHCGFSSVVTDECGVKVPVGSLTQMAKHYASALRSIMEDEEWRRALSTGALKRAHEFSWSTKTKTLNALYSSATHV